MEVTWPYKLEASLMQQQGSEQIEVLSSCITAQLLVQLDRCIKKRACMMEAKS